MRATASWRAPIYLRPWRNSDSSQALTELLHRAFAGLARKGLDCASGRQSAAQTAQRLQRGQTLVAELDGRLIGTLSLYDSQPHSEAHSYRAPDVASIHQFAVDPTWQGQGVGEALLRLAERRARAQGKRRLALDTPQLARHLLAYYLRHGFQIEESLRFTGRSYHSVVLCKVLG
jgi:GNAT superfamily N-acetyltransferase